MSYALEIGEFQRDFRQKALRLLNLTYSEDPELRQKRCHPRGVHLKDDSASALKKIGCKRKEGFIHRRDASVHDIVRAVSAAEQAMIRPSRRQFALTDTHAFTGLSPVPSCA